MSLLLRLALQLKKKQSGTHTPTERKRHLANVHEKSNMRCIAIQNKSSSGDEIPERDVTYHLI